MVYEMQTGHVELCEMQEGFIDAQQHLGVLPEQVSAPQLGGGGVAFGSQLTFPFP